LKKLQTLNFNKQTFEIKPDTLQPLSYILIHFLISPKQTTPIYHPLRLRALRCASKSCPRSSSVLFRFLPRNRAISFRERAWERTRGGGGGRRSDDCCWPTRSRGKKKKKKRNTQTPLTPSSSAVYHHVYGQQEESGGPRILLVSAPMVKSSSPSVSRCCCCCCW